MTKKSNTTVEDFRPIEWVEVPYYSSGVRAGIPERPGDEAYETISIPKEFAAIINFVIPVKGESMRDFGLQEGDNLCVHSQPTADNGDIVVASIDGECTVKTYYEDVDGSKWLVPGNPDFKPIYLDPDSDVRIFGVVKQIMQINPHVSLCDCAARVRPVQKEYAKHRAYEFPLFTQKAIDDKCREKMFERLQSAAMGSGADLMKELHLQAQMGYVEYTYTSTKELTEIIHKFLNDKFRYENVRRNRLDK